MKRAPSLGRGLITPWLTGWLLCGLAAGAVLAEEVPSPGAVTAPAPVMGRDYVEVPPLPGEASPSGTVEVIEFFSWGCPHCFHFHPTVDAWSKKLPAYVRFRRVPVSFGREDWKALVQLFYVLQELGQLDQLDSAIFDAIHVDGKPFGTLEDLASLVAGHGIDRERFLQLAHSPQILARVAHAHWLAVSYGIQSVPQLVVGGHYVVIGQGVANYGDLLGIADRLIAMARS